ncbi:MAG TPA: diguanylate cyclase, partial [Gammaproteobacteria bacterium]|nr:diguanylate cyclase [Gammaproteobacteria bacterium]
MASPSSGTLQPDGLPLLERTLPGPLAGLVLLLLLALVAPMAGQWLIKAMSPEAVLAEEDIHSLLEGIGAFISLGLASLLFMRMEFEEVPRTGRGVACGLATMGLFDTFHAAVAPGQDFVWMHTLASLSGGLFFALAFVPVPNPVPGLSRYFPLALLAGVLLYAVGALLNPGLTPLMVENGTFTATPLVLNLLSGLLFWAAALGFLRHFLSHPSWESLLFGMLSGFLGTSGMLFGESSLWDATWWWWHLLRLTAFSLAFFYILATFFRWQREIKALNSQLDEAKQNLEHRLRDLARENTERREAEHALRKSENRFRRLYNKTPTMLLSLDPAGRVTEVSDFWLEHTGYTRGEVLEQLLRNFLAPSFRTELESALANFFETGHLRDLELDLVRKDGSVINSLVSAAGEYDLQGRIHRSIMVVNDITARKEREAEIEQLAFYDVLTGLPNRRLLGERASQAIALAQRSQNPLSVMYVDLDRFKDINDTCGHEAGDRLLVSIAQKLQGLTRKSDTLARVGGDEFVFLLPDTEADQAKTLAERIARSLETPFLEEGHQFHTTASAGITQFPQDGVNLNELLKNADIAMFRAKEEGLEYQQFHPELQHSVQVRVQRETELREAVRKQELDVYFQPQMDLAGRRVVGCEALVRWHHPKWGPVSPGDFIPLAEQTGLIHDLGRQVLEEAVSWTRVWRESRSSGFRVAVNLSVHELQAPGIAEAVSEVLDCHGVPGQ